MPIYFISLDCCVRQGSHDFIVDLGITHVPMDTSNVKQKRACRVMDHFSIELGQIRLQASVHRIEKNGSKKTLFFFFDPTCFSIRSGMIINRVWPGWIEKVLTVISCNGAPGEAGNSSSGKMLEKAPTHSEARKTNFQHFRGKSSCERAEKYFFNGLQIQLHINKNWPKTGTSSVVTKLRQRDTIIQQCSTS